VLKLLGDRALVEVEVEVVLPMVEVDEEWQQASQEEVLGFEAVLVDEL